jgi:hypothetical protein
LNLGQGQKKSCFPSLENSFKLFSLLSRIEKDYFFSSSGFTEALASGATEALASGFTEALALASGATEAEALETLISTDAEA